MFGVTTLQTLQFLRGMHDLGYMAHFARSTTQQNISGLNSEHHAPADKHDKKTESISGHISNLSTIRRKEPREKNAHGVFFKEIGSFAPSIAEIERTPEAK